jgi:hypothetical protein
MASILRGLEASINPGGFNRARSGSKHHLICDAGGIPLAVTLTGGNRNDTTQLIPLLDAVPPIRGRRGRPRRRPREPFADRGYDHDICRDSCAPGASPRGSPAAGSHTAPAWADTAGWSSAASPGSTPSNGCAHATNAEPTSTSAYFS